jgi:hypothetical protein
MLIILHRRNKSSELRKIPNNFGIEIDIRSHKGNLILQHDPFKEGESFESWLEFWTGQFLVLNTKEEGLEQSILKILSKRKISDYFFLDQSFPSLVKSLRSDNLNVSVRFSDLESLETALAVNCQWVWVDCFNGNWDFLVEAVPTLKLQNRKICLVSPELVRNSTELELQELQNILLRNNLQIDAVCTKNRDFWASTLNEESF